MKYFKIFEASFNEAVQLKNIFRAFFWVILTVSVAHLLQFEITWKLFVLIFASDFFDKVIYDRK